MKILVVDDHPLILEALKQVLRDLEPDIEVQASMIRTLTAAMSGRVDDIDDELDRGERLATMLQDTHPLARDQIGLNRVLTLHTRAEFDASRHLVESVRGAADFSARLMGPWYYIDGLADLLRGDVDRAIEHTTSSIRLLRERDDVGTRPMALALGGLAYAMRDDELRAQELIDESLADGGERQIRSRLWIDVAGAWIAAQRGDLLEGARRAVAAGRDAIVSGHTVWGAVAVHTAVRFGHADLAAPALADLDAGPLASLLADHANADDAVALAKVADDLVDHAMLGLAAEVWATIARHETADDLVRAPAALRASALTDRSPGLHSPLVESLPSPLTPRQHQIAVLAARGRPTGAIADELFVSTKTVDNHLQNIYRVLGIGSRSELAQILDD